MKFKILIIRWIDVGCDHHLQSVAKLVTHSAKFWNFLDERRTTATKNKVCQISPRPPNQCWSLFPALWSFRVWSTLCRGEGGKFYLGLGCSKIRQKRSSVSLLLKPIVVHPKEIEVILIATIGGPGWTQLDTQQSFHTSPTNEIGRSVMVSEMQWQNDSSSYCRWMYQRNIADELLVKFAIYSEILDLTVVFWRGAGDILAWGNMQNESSASIGVGSKYLFGSSIWHLFA